MREHEESPVSLGSRLKFDQLDPSYYCSLQHMRFVSDAAKRQAVYAKRALTKYTLLQSRLTETDPDYVKKIEAFTKIEQAYYDLFYLVKTLRCDIRDGVPQ